MQQDDRDVNKAIDDFLSEPPSSSGEVAIKVGIAVFIALISVFLIKEAYEQYQLTQLKRAIVSTTKTLSYDLDRINARTQERLRAANLESQKRLNEMRVKNEIAAKEREKKRYLDNYWKDIGNGTFINLGRSKRNGDLATALIKTNNRQQTVNVNCNNRTYWSNENNGWFSAPDSFTTEYKIIHTACFSTNEFSSFP